MDHPGLFTREVISASRTVGCGLGRSLEGLIWLVTGVCGLLIWDMCTSYILSSGYRTSNHGNRFLGVVLKMPAVATRQCTGSQIPSSLAKLL